MIQKPKIRANFTGRESVPLGNFEQSVTQQALENETNVNAIMQRALKTGFMPTPRNQIAPMYGDFTNGADFQQAQNSIIQAQASFEALPSNIRNRFRNSPAEFLDFMSDESNKEEAQKLGLLPPDPVVDPPSNDPKTEPESPKKAEN